MGVNALFWLYDMRICARNDQLKLGLSHFPIVAGQVFKLEESQKAGKGVQKRNLPADNER